MRESGHRRTKIDIKYPINAWQGQNGNLCQQELVGYKLKVASPLAKHCEREGEIGKDDSNVNLV